MGGGQAGRQTGRTRADDHDVPIGQVAEVELFVEFRDFEVDHGQCALGLRIVAERKADHVQTGVRVVHDGTGRGRIVREHIKRRQFVLGQRGGQRREQRIVLRVLLQLARVSSEVNNSYQWRSVSSKRPIENRAGVAPLVSLPSTSTMRL